MLYSFKVCVENIGKLRWYVQFADVARLGLAGGEHFYAWAKVGAR